MEFLELGTSSLEISGRQSSTGRLSGSWRSRSISSNSRGGSNRYITEDLLDEINAQAGDTGGRPFGDHDGSSWSEAPMDTQRQPTGTAGGLNLADDAVLLSNRFRVHPADLNASPVSPFESEITSHDIPAADIILGSRDDNMSMSVREIKRSLSTQEKVYVLLGPLDHLLYLLHLAVFGIIGAITRYLLQKLFGPGILKFTSDETSFYLDLPSNMVGSFLMGWFGVVFKGDMRHISDHLVVGITTGYLGSLTTFSGWNQKMLVLSSDDHWVFTVAGIVLGMFLVNESINIGVETAESFKGYIKKRLGSDGICIPESWRIDRPSRHITAMVMMLLILGVFWGTSGILVRAQMDDLSSNAILWLGCLLAPAGVWLRWYLARLNGQGIGRKKSLKWLPIGTLGANVLAACIMAALATINKEVNTRRCYLIVSGVQFGFLGCLSTVSTFAAEVYAMRQTRRSGRAFTYVSATLILSFILGTLLYSVPVWTKHYK